MINENAGNTIKITVSVTRKYQKQDITVGAEIDILSSSGVASAYEALYDSVMMQHRLIVERAARSMPMPEPKNGVAIEEEEEEGEGEDENPRNNNNYVEIEVESINLEYKGTKPYYKVKGGKFSKWGVRLWTDPIVIKAVSRLIDFKEFKAGDNPVEGIAAQIEMNGDKAIRVSKLYSLDGRIDF